jgi:manganese/zinc/iron transport system substrate-binding protein
LQLEPIHLWFGQVEIDSQLLANPGRPAIAKGVFVTPLQGRNSGLVLAAALCLAWPAAAQAEDRPQVIATVGMVADVAAQVAGDCAEVRALMGPGTDPHLYRPTAGDVRRLRAADAILYVGFGLEGQLGEVLDRLEDSIPTLAVGPASVPTGELIAVQDLYGIDPHLWMDVRLWSMTVPAIAGVLADLAPDCEGIDQRADDYLERLEALHGWVGESIASIPESSRALVTAHDAFAYFARAYGIEEVAIQGISTESEAGIRDIREAADLVAERGVPAVFIETTINPRTIEALIEAVRDRSKEVRIGGELYSDAMGDAGTAEGTYIGMIMANTTTITEALGGQAPPLPHPVADWLEARGLAGD